MLILTRRPGEKILIDGGIEVICLGAQHGQVRLGFVAPIETNIIREELKDSPYQNGLGNQGDVDIGSYEDIRGE